SPPSGLGTLDPWLDALGDEMFGDIKLGSHAVVYEGGALDTASPGQLQFNGHNVCYETSPFCGAVRRIDTGAGLTGGPITTEGTLSVATGGIVTGMVADGAVTEGKLAFDPATQAELDAYVPDWNDLSNVPAGFADGIDDDTTYTAGAGLSLAGTAFSADTAYLQRRVATGCAAGSSVREIAGDGAVTCEDDTDTDTNTLAELACSTGEIAKWNGASWACAADVDTDTDTDTLGALACATGELPKWDGMTWACGSDIDTDTDTDTLGALACADGEIAKRTAGAWACAADAAGGDADLLDGLDSGAFLRSDADDTYTAGTLTFAAGTAVQVDGTIAIGADDDVDDVLGFNGGLESLYWDDAFQELQASDDFRAEGDLFAQGDLNAVGGEVHLRSLGPDGDSSVCFWEDGAQCNDYVRWFDAGDQFVVTDDVFLFDSLLVGSNLEALDLDLRGTTLDMKVNGPDGTQSIRFYEDGAAAGETFGWTDATDEFDVSDDLDVAGEVQLDFLRTGTTNGVCHSGVDADLP
ncbi:MAG: hypothetical protein L0206_11385, partial [Actinobacteria bacterium]|nr:hypothetical protein [Actinomycetota bacterium]